MIHMLWLQSGPSCCRSRPSPCVLTSPQTGLPPGSYGDRKALPTLTVGPLHGLFHLPEHSSLRPLLWCLHAFRSLLRRHSPVESALSTLSCCAFLLPGIFQLPEWTFLTVPLFIVSPPVRIVAELERGPLADTSSDVFRYPGQCLAQPRSQ